MTINLHPGRFCKWPFLLFLFNMVLCVSSQLWAQSRIFRWYEDNELERLEALLDDDEFLNRDGEDVRFLKTIFEKNGNDAVEKFKALIRSGPRSAGMPAVIERVALHQYASGLYNTARTTFLYIADNYGRTPFGERGLYYAARCWQAIGRTDSTRLIVGRLRRRYSRSPYLAMLDIDLTASRSEPGSIKLAENELGSSLTFSVQAGAFLTEANARIQKQFLEDKGFQAEIYAKSVERQKYYVVCVGRFNNKLDAENQGNEIQKRYRIDYQIVDLDVLDKER